MKPIKFVTDPPGAIVEKRNFEGDWDYLGLSGEKEIPVSYTEIERENSLRIRFRFELPDGRVWTSEPVDLPGETFVRSSSFPTSGSYHLDVPVWDRFLIAASRRPLLAGLIVLGIPGLFLGAFFTRKRWIAGLRSAVSPEGSVGTTYGDYTVIGTLGKGAMGVVYLGETQAGLKVAIKSVLPEYAEDPEFAQRFDHELRACVSLNHPNLLKYHGHGIDSNGVPFSVTELLHGRTLKETIAEGVTNPQRLASDLIEQIGLALDYLHDQGLVHRDIKPDNIFVCDDGNLKLMDLGLVKGEAMTVLTRTGHVLGTPAYMPPEQFDGQTGPASDQYGLGIILYEILTGSRPFTQPDLFALAYQHKTAKPTPLRQLEPRVTEDIEQAIMRMLAKRPEERFSSISEIRDAISDKLLYLPWAGDVAKKEASKEKPAEQQDQEKEASFWIGKEIGPYKIESFLGKGGMATVFKGVEASTGRTVAIKLMQPSLASEEEYRKRFEREATIGEKLKHKNIVELLEWGEYEGRLYLVLEFVDGQDLSAEIKEGGQALGNVVDLITSILDALSYAHSQGVVHRDLKPPNIMLTSEGVPKVTDFGLARSEELAKLTKTGQAVGTPAYFPPEQIHGAAPTPAADQYSLGIVFYELLCGVRPFRKKLPMELLLQQVSEVPANPVQHRDDLPPLAARVILRMLEKSPEARFESLEVAKQGFEAAARGEEWCLPEAPSVEEAAPSSVSVSPVLQEDSGDDTIGFEVK